MNASRLHGLYAITDPVLCADNLQEDAARAIEAGVQILQYRNKQAPPARQHQEALALAGLCQRHGVLFIVNDDAKLAAEVGADGVHLGQQDGAVDEARRLLGNQAIIGISCNNRYDYALAAREQGADYIAFGRFFASRTKAEAPQAHPDLLRRARTELALPVVAIGGITPGNGAALLQAGAHMLAVIHGIFGSPDIERAVQEYRRLFEQHSTRLSEG